MEIPAPKCPSCGSEKQITRAKLTAESDLHVLVEGKRKPRETWKDPILVYALSPVTVRICEDCGHISLWTGDLAGIRNAAAKLGGEQKL